MTGYRMISTVGDASENGCEVTYLTQSDPKGMYTSVISHSSTLKVCTHAADVVHHELLYLSLFYLL